MQRSFHTGALWASAAVLLAAILVVGFFQLRFLDRLHEAETARREADLDRGLKEFQRGFDQTLLDWQGTLQNSLRVLPRVAELQPLWQRELPRGLVREGYVCEPGPAGKWLRLSPSGPPAPLGRPPSGLACGRPETFGLPQPFGEEGLAVSLLSMAARPPRPRDGEVAISILSAPTLVIAILDRRVLEQTVVHPLARRTLPTWEDALEYGVIELPGAGRPGRLLFRSSPHLEPADLRHPAGSVGLLSPENIRLSMLGVPAIRPAVGIAPERAPDVRSIAFGSALPGEVGRSWALAVRLPEGSLARELAGLRRKNLLLTGASLAFLVLSLALLVFLSLRAARLAEAQVDFVSSVSHELRTPLAVIRTASANLADGLVVEPEQVRRYGVTLEREARRLGELVYRVLLLSRTAQGLPVQPVDLAPLVDKVLAPFRGEIAEHGLALEVRVPPDLPPVAAHPEALESALENLVNNAVKYGREGGRLDISARVEGSDRGAEVAIAVTDFGPGIDARDRAHLFEPFYRGRLARSRALPGTGLGLYVVERVMRGSSGRVTVTSGPGGPTTFRLHLPAVSEEDL